MPGGWGGSGWGGSPWGGGAAPAGGGGGTLPDNNNLSYEIPDGVGGALDWTVVTVSTYQEYAAYGQGTLVDTTYAEERFEGGWGLGLTPPPGSGGNELAIFAWPSSGPQAALYSAKWLPVPVAAENFETGWGINPVGTFANPSLASTPYFFQGESLEAGTYATAAGPRAPLDGFETEWRNDAYEFAFVSGDTSPALFGGTLHAEGFEHGWANDAYEFAFVFGDTALALYAADIATSHAHEDFELVKLDAGATVALDGTWTQATHHLADSDGVFLIQPAGGSLPAGFFPGVQYAVVNVTLNTFQLALVIAGSAVVPTTTGVGLALTHCPFQFWTIQLASI